MCHIQIMLHIAPTYETQTQISNREPKNGIVSRSVNCDKKKANKVYSIFYQENDDRKKIKTTTKILSRL